MGALSQSFTFVPSADVGNTATTAVVYPNSTNTTQTYVSNPLKGDGYYGSSDGVHTVQYTMSNDFIGTVTMQATLATAPQASDWFPVTDTTSEYTAMTNNNASSVTANMVDIYNFVGNFVWVQCVVAIDHGSVFTVQYNH